MSRKQKTEQHITTKDLARLRRNQTGKDRHHHEGHEEHEVNRVQTIIFRTLRVLRVLRGCDGIYLLMRIYTPYFRKFAQAAKIFKHSSTESD
jgi:hypothetical protein